MAIERRFQLVYTNMVKWQLNSALHSISLLPLSKYRLSQTWKFQDTSAHRRFISSVQISNLISKPYLAVLSFCLFKKTNSSMKKRQWRGTRLAKSCDKLQNNRVLTFISPKESFRFEERLGSWKRSWFHKLFEVQTWNRLGPMVLQRTRQELLTILSILLNILAHPSTKQKHLRDS